MSDDLRDVQSELQSVKKALRDGGSYLGMSGEPLQKYFLQLNEKENILLSSNLQPTKGYPATNGAQLGLLGASSPMYTAPLGVNGSHKSGSESVSPQELKPARPVPDTVQTLQRDSLQAVVEHLVVYEGSSLECVKALRALSSLAYSDAEKVGAHDQVLAQVMRVCDLHPSEESVWLAAMRAICNIAYSAEIAITKFTIPVLSKLLFVLGKSSMKDAGLKAGEALARVIAAEVSANSDAPEDDAAPKPPKLDGRSPMASLIVAATEVDADAHPAIIQLLAQLISNEVVEVPFVAERFVAAAPACFKVSGLATARWLQLSKLLAGDSPEMGAALVERQALPRAVDAMCAHVQHGLCQLSGIEAMSILVGNRWNALQAFAENKGIAAIEVAMRQHANEAVLQTKSIRALASGVAWPENIRVKAGYSYKTGVELTKVAMGNHESVQELQEAALEALSKYLDNLKCAEDIKADRGADVIQAVMSKHSGSEAVKRWGNKVLDGLR